MDENIQPEISGATKEAAVQLNEQPTTQPVAQPAPVTQPAAQQTPAVDSVSAASSPKQKPKPKSSATYKMWTVIGVILCIIFIPILVVNCTLIVKGYLNENEVPTLGGIAPMIVMSDSMYPEIQKGDLIIINQVSPSDVKAGDIVCFYNPNKNDRTTVTHRVLEVVNDNGVIKYRTQGDANTSEDAELVNSAELVGRYSSRIPGLGNVAMFMQTTPGLIIFVIVPIVLLILYDVLRRRHFAKKDQEDTEALKRELEELRAKQKANG